MGKIKFPRNYQVAWGKKKSTIERYILLSLQHQTSKMFVHIIIHATGAQAIPKNELVLKFCASV